MKQFATLVFIAGLFSNHLLPEAQYANGACTGKICVLINNDEIECIEDPDGGSPDTQISLETYTEAGVYTISYMNDVAVSPIDGTIYVMYALGGVDKIGTIDDPINNPCASNCQVTPIASLTYNQYSGMTFDCLGNLYAITKPGPLIIQIDTVSGNETVIDTTVAKSCTLDCVESLFYNFDDEIFYHLSSHMQAGYMDMFYVRYTIDGADASGTIPSRGGICNQNVFGVQDEAVTYIGNEVSLISCRAESNTLLLLQGTPYNPAVTVLSGSTINSYAFGIFNYNEDGSICKPQSCTNAPTHQLPSRSPSNHPTYSPSTVTSHPTKYPTTQPTLSPTEYPTLSPTYSPTHPVENPTKTPQVIATTGSTTTSVGSEVESESLEPLKSESVGSESSAATAAIIGILGVIVGCICCVCIIVLILFTFSNK
eukprot:259144_1